MVGVAIGLASASIMLGGMPALADSVRQHEWWLGQLGVTSAWQTTRGSGVTVAVLGDGTEPSNPDLAGSVITGPDFTRSGRTARGPYFGLRDTAIASLIAGHGHGTDASEGIIGVAPAAKILSVRVTLSAGDPLLTSTAVTARLPGAIAAGIRYAVRKGARVIDLPIDPGQPGASGTGGASAAAGGSAAERAAVSYALRKGVVLVAPAGDNGAGRDAVSYPAAYPGVISAGAFDRTLMKAAYSSHQSYVTLTAPGEGVIAATAAGSYATMNSTSTAGAIVAGIAALIRSRFPVLSPAQVNRALIHSTLFRRPGGTQDGSGYGTANAGRAMARAKLIAAPLARRAAASPPATPRAPTPPQVPSAASSLVSKVLKAVVISAGVLILLLLPITAYAAAGRRRTRRAVQARWERDQPAETGYAHAGAAPAPDHADPMLEYFAPPARPPISMFPAEPGPRAEPGSPPETPFLAGHGRNAGPRPSAADQGRGDPGRLAGPVSPLSAWPGSASASGRPASTGAAGDLDDSGAASSFPAAGDPFGPARNPFAPARHPHVPAENPHGTPGNPFAPAGNPPRPAGNPPEPAGNPFAPAENPFAPASDPFGPAHDPFRTASDPPAGAAGDQPGPAGRTRAGSHSRTGNPAPRPAQGPAPRQASRQPRISGTPPWEPAAEPNSELPWADGPAPQRAHPAHVQPTHPARAAHRRTQRSAPPPVAAGSPWPDAPAPASAAPPEAGAGSIWDAAARTPRGPDARDSRGHHAGGHDAGGHDAGNGADPRSDAGSSEPGSEDPGTGPIYVWNPGASTETFPSVPVHRDPPAPKHGDPSAPVDRD
jgi:serine protease